MAFELIEHVTGDLILGEAHQVVFLAAVVQVHLGTVVACTRLRRIGRLARRRQVTVQAHFIDEGVALFHLDPHTHAALGLAQQGLHIQPLVAQLGRGFFQGRGHVLVHEALDHRLGRLQVQLGQALAETATAAGRQLRLFLLDPGVLGHGLVQAEHEAHQHHRERQASQYHHGLHGLEVTGEQQADGHQGDHDRPEDPQPVRGVFVDVTALAGQVGHHHRAGVGRGQEQHEAHEDRHTDDDLRRRVMLEQLVDRHGRLFQGGLAQLHRALVEHQVQGRVAEDRQPGQGEAQRDQQYASHQLAHGTTTGNTSDEHADKRCPGNPPGPVEQGPQAQPAIGLGTVAFIHIEVECLEHHAVEVVADVLHEAVEQVQGRTEQQDEDQQATEQDDVQVGQAANAVLHPGYRGDGGHRAHDDDHDQQVGVAVLHAEQVFQAGRYLHRANAQVGHQAQQGHEHAETVHRVAGRALDPALADQWVQRRPQGQRLVMPVGEVRHRQAHQGIDRPAVQAPVQECQLQRLARGLVAGRHAFGRVEVVVQGLGRTEVQQRDADAGREQHPGPGAIAEVRGILLGPQLELAVGRKRQAHHEHQVGGDHQHVVPAETAGQPGLGNVQHLAGLLRGDDQDGSQQQDQRGRGIEHPTVDPHLFRRGLYKRGRTHCTDAPGSAREGHKATRHPTNRLVGSRSSGDIKTPRKKPGPTAAALRTSIPDLDSNPWFGVRPEASCPFNTSVLTGSRHAIPGVRSFSEVVFRHLHAGRIRRQRRFVADLILC